MCESSAFLLGKNNELTRVSWRKNIRWVYKRNKINRSQNNISSRLIVVFIY